jgi:Zn-dependent protease/CBS domain-containing protein
MSIAPPPDQRNEEKALAPPRPIARDPWSLHLVTVAGIPIRLHFTFLLFLLWIGFAGAQGFQWTRVLFVLTLFACVIFHELGHSLVAMRYDIPVSSITMYPIGGVAAIEKQPEPKQEFWIALAGPAVNVVIAAILYVVLAIQGQTSTLTQTVSSEQIGTGSFLPALLGLNILLVLFNLIPAFPMDGGRVLRAVLAMNIGSARATAIAARIGQFIAIAAGCWAIFSRPLNPWYLLIAFFVYLGAGQEAGAYREAALTQGVHVRDAMLTDVRTLSVGDTLKEAADVLLDTSQHDFPVVHGDAVLGLLTRNDLLRGLSELGPSGYVAGAMQRQFAAVGPDDELSEVLPRVQSTPGPLLVMEGEHLLGIVTTDNIQEFFAIRQIAARSQAQTER